ncbi:MFS transporter [Opitutus terrae]|uniref:Sugar (Glycoside-Pentoside-Hexuronide) transporter n=1 Tax=Opitutus terrae (strain DSM 11246 / JCM 15787 / PB90-1) TaxID=452637 RepID=B1ZPN5_OPITP|nr:MFS transporter [Opitutus terrae]ACB74554.1 sugar (Glycoside-Pentoside-Hexuronide) transporter [Opitutus terrae PB90-1]
MNPPVSTPAPVPRLSFREKFAYGLGDTASNFYFQAFNLFLVYYYTDIFGLQSTSVGTLMFITPILVAVLNPVIGAIADRTNSRWGKFRPYILWGAIPYGLLGVLMFANPNLSTDGKLIYAYVTYTLVLITYAAINTPYGALMGVMSPSSEDRTSLSTYRFACAFTGALLIGWLVPWLKDALTGVTGNPAIGFRNTMWIFAAVSVGMFFYTFANTRERVAPPPTQKSSLREDIGDLMRNPPWLILFFVAFLNLTNVGMRSGSGIYYFKYCVGNEAALGTFNLVGFLCFIAGALSTKLLLRLLPRRGLMITCTVVNALTMAAFYFVDPHSTVLLYVLNIVGQFVAGPTPAIVWSMYADTADYGEWKNGRRATGLVFSATVFAQKVGLAIGSAMLGWMLSYYGFVANAAQSPRAIHGITILFSLLPALFGGLSGLAILFYKIDEPLVKQIERDLAARKAAPATAVSTS